MDIYTCINTFVRGTACGGAEAKEEGCASQIRAALVVPPRHRHNVHAHQNLCHTHVSSETITGSA